MATLPENRQLSEADLERLQQEREARATGELRSVVAKGIEAQKLLDEESNRAKASADATAPIIDGLPDVKVESLSTGEPLIVEASDDKKPSVIPKEDLGKLIEQTLNGETDISVIAHQMTEKALGEKKPE